MNPLVCCVCLTHRREFLKQAIDCFINQTYEPKALITLSTVKIPGSIGALRNMGAAMTPAGSLIAHWDDDDWSSPVRLTEQVAFITKHGCEKCNWGGHNTLPHCPWCKLPYDPSRKPPSVVGYSDLPFYDVGADRVQLYRSGIPNYGVGTSLLYKREVWERVPFPDSMCEDGTWQTQVKFQFGDDAVQGEMCLKPEPRMIARIHSGNTSSKTGANYEAADAELDAQVRSLLF